MNSGKIKSQRDLGLKDKKDGVVIGVRGNFGKGVDWEVQLDVEVSE